MSRTQPPELLAARQQLSGFRCRSVEPTTWLVETARQAHGTGTTRVSVVTEVDHNVVVADYAWNMASVAVADLPERLRRGAGRTPQPMALLARLGIDERHEGQGLGAGPGRQQQRRSAAPSALRRCPPSPWPQGHRAGRRRWQPHRRRHR